MTTQAVRLPRVPRVGGLSWVTWRQHRLGISGVVVLFGAFSVLLLLTGHSIHHTYASLGLNRCGDFETPGCRSAMEVFQQQYDGWGQFLPRILEFVPALIGVFMGAPLVARELESGTFRFAWTQGRSRIHWIAVKLVLIGAVLTVLALAFSLLFAWWFKPFEPTMGRMIPGQGYEVLGIVFALRTLFAFTLGVFLGAVIRRSIPAMAATLAAWLAVAWPTVLWVRPLIETPITAPANSNLITENGWTVHDWIQDPAGHHLSQVQIFTLAQKSRVDARTSFIDWLTQHHYTEWVSFQPDNRFWHFQVIEGSCYLVASLLLAGAAVWWIRRRAT